MLFSPDQIQELIYIIRSQHILFGIQMSGKDIISNDDLTVLKKFGINPSQIDVDIPYSEQAFQFGRLASALGNYNIRKVSYSNFKKFVQGGGHRGLSDYEKRILEAIKRQSFDAVKNLGGKIEGDLRNSINYGEVKRRSDYEKVLRKELSEGVINRKSVAEITRELGIKTSDWERDLGRLVATESHNAYEEGRASEIAHKHGSDALVYKDVYSGACTSCIKAYLTGDINSEPKIFKLSQLIANATNIGKKSKEYLPVLGAMHPNCRCTLNVYQEGLSWDAKKRDFVRSGKYKQRYVYNISIKIGDDNFQI